MVHLIFADIYIHIENISNNLICTLRNSLSRWAIVHVYYTFILNMKFAPYIGQVLREKEEHIT